MSEIPASRAGSNRRIVVYRQPLTLRALLILLVAAYIGCGVTLAHATADGPDHYRVIGVDADDVLDIRTEPAVAGRRISTIPPDGDGIVAFGCIGGLSAAVWQQSSDAERAASRKTRWCLVGHDRVIGWSAAWLLAEGSGPDSFRGGGRLAGLAGSEWLLRDLGGIPAAADAWIGFKSDGTAIGNSACNEFNTKYEENPGVLSLAPIAMTRRACPGAGGGTEKAFMAALDATEKVVATHLLLALFDVDDTLLATLTRRDAD